MNSQTISLITDWLEDGMGLTVSIAKQDGLIVVASEDGYTLAVPYWSTPISSKQIQSVTNSILSDGFDVLWLLEGDAAQPDAIRECTALTGNTYAIQEDCLWVARPTRRYWTKITKEPTDTVPVEEQIQRFRKLGKFHHTERRVRFKPQMAAA